MQTREMWKKSKWKVVAGAATLSALGISGLALADPSNSPVPASIELSDQVSGVGLQRPAPDFVLNLNDDQSSDSDSPFDDVGTGDSESVSGDTPAGLDTLTGDSVDTLALDSGDEDSVDSVVPSPTVPGPGADDSISIDSADSADSADGSSES
jgi:hypothetical protein